MNPNNQHPISDSELAKAIEEVESSYEFIFQEIPTNIKTILNYAKQVQEHQTTIQYCAKLLKDFGLDEAAPLEALTRRIIKQVQELQERNKELEDINQQLFHTRSTTAQAMVYQSLLIKYKGLKQSFREKEAEILNLKTFINVLRMTHDLDIEDEQWEKIGFGKK